MLPNQVPQTERVKVTHIYHRTALSGTGRGRAWQVDLLGVSGIKAQSSGRLLAKFGLLSVSCHMAASFSKPTQGKSLASNTSQLQTSDISVSDCYSQISRACVMRSSTQITSPILKVNWFGTSITLSKFLTATSRLVFAGIWLGGGVCTP